MSYVECRIDRVKESMREGLFSYAASSLFHAILFLTLALVLGNISPRPPLGDALSIESFATEERPAEPLNTITIPDDSPAPPDPGTDSPTLTPASQPLGDPRGVSDVGDDAPEQDAGGGQPDGQRSAIIGLTSVGAQGLGLGPMLPGINIAGPGIGTGKDFGTGGPGFGFRTLGPRRGVPDGSGRARDGDRAVAGALDWLARHQGPDGGWSLDYHNRCKNPSCTGVGDSHSEAAATAMGLLPFLAAGHTHQSRCHYQKVVRAALAWLLSRQKPTGDLSAGGSQMYSHGLATIALCEAYGMTADSKLRARRRRRCASSRSARTRRPAAGGTRIASRAATRRSPAGR